MEASAPPTSAAVALQSFDFLPGGAPKHPKTTMTTTTIDRVSCGDSKHTFRMVSINRGAMSKTMPLS
eukprot:COSAG05_NODE_1121_length_5808_cov_2.774391_4_plen_67_part_00